MLALRRLTLLIAVIVVVAVLPAALYLGWMVLSTKLGVAARAGTRAGLAVDAPITIARDARGIPHIRASTDHDLFFAEGYAMAADRLFQMDLTRRYVYGRLTEILGSPLLQVDERMRNYGIARIAAVAYDGAGAEEKAQLQAFADGINAAATHEPTPPEYHALFAGFQPWRPQDAIAVGYATVLDLDDEARWIIPRDWIHRALGQAGTDAFFPLTDPKYDIPTDGEPAGTIPPLPNLRGVTADRRSPVVTLSPFDKLRTSGDPASIAPDHQTIGSNAWAVGADRTTTGRAILANDPHLDLGIPGIWWLVEARSPHFHIAGAALAGTPGVTLGHNENFAWGVTAAQTAAMRLLREPVRGSDEFFEDAQWLQARHRHERFIVRFGKTVDEDVLETPKGTMIERTGDTAYVRDWRMAIRPVSPISIFTNLDRARSIEDGIAALRNLPEPALNVVLADTTGRVAYQLAGGVPVDDVEGRWAVDGDIGEPPLLPFDRAPHVAASRSAIVVSSNNRSSGAGSPRLAPYFPPPYRAFEVRSALFGAMDRNGRLTPDAIAAVQADNFSPAERELQQLVLAAAARMHADSDATTSGLLGVLRTFDGGLVPSSRGGTAVVALRRELFGRLVGFHMPSDVGTPYLRDSGSFAVLLRALRERPKGWVPLDDYDAFIMRGMRAVQASFGGAIPTFGDWAAQPLHHPLAPFGFRAWNGPTFAGHGGSFAPAVQWAGHGQSFRAIWSPGDWDNGTIDIDAGESGEPGSPHYTDQSAAWERYAHTKLPFSDGAVQSAARSTLTLTR